MADRWNSNTRIIRTNFMSPWVFEFSRFYCILNGQWSKFSKVLSKTILTRINNNFKIFDYSSANIYKVSQIHMQQQKSKIKTSNKTWADGNALVQLQWKLDIASVFVPCIEVFVKNCLYMEFNLFGNLNIDD